MISLPKREVGKYLLWQHWSTGQLDDFVFNLTVDNISELNLSRYLGTEPCIGP